MNRAIPIFLLILGISCSGPEEPKSDPVNETPSEEIKEKKIVEEPTAEPAQEAKKYENQRFRNVEVKKTGADTYRITGQGQIFEANFGYVVEDGHNELLSGHTMTDAGAPEWGNFDFNITVKKANPNSTLHLILFESSAEDGRRVYELPIPLPG